MAKNRQTRRNDKGICIFGRRGAAKIGSNAKNNKLNKQTDNNTAGVSNNRKWFVEDGANQPLAVVYNPGLTSDICQ